MTQTTPPEDQGWSDPASPAPSEPAPTATTYASSDPVATGALQSTRPSMVTGAGITLIVLGALTLLVGVLGALAALIFATAFGSATGEGGGAVPPEMAGVMGAFAGLAFLFVIIVLAFGGLQLLAGIKVLGGRSWARTTGIVLAVIGGLLALLGLSGAEGGGIILNLAFVAANGFVIWALITTGPWFRARTA